MGKSDIIQRVEELVLPVIHGEGAELIEITYKREGAVNVLRMFVDKPSGVTLDELSGINTRISEMLDTNMVIDEEYTLEVSSPGLDRILKARKDFEWALGKDIKISTYAPVEGDNVFIGKLVGLSEGAVVIKGKDGVSREIPSDKIAKARLHAV
ncbi:MAG: ribosome maturation factor RimP [Candidatus Omnitrophota bacterium]